MKLTEQMILTLAPNASAGANGKKLSRGGSFSRHGRNEEETVFWADCAGSGKNPYQTSADLADPEGKIVCRCSCPSRQFPCKHGLGLLYEILSGREFPVAAMPEDLTRKREKQAQRKEKTEIPAPTAEKKPSNAWKKKLEKQLEGLDLAQRMVSELLSGGISTLSGTSAQSFEKAAKELGNYYLTGPQTEFTRIAQIVRDIQRKDTSAEEQYRQALTVLIRLHGTIKKSRTYLTEKLASGQPGPEDSPLYEALGGVWRLEDLKAVGAYRENVRLVQLSFDVSYEQARKEFIDRGFWLDLEQGSIYQTLNYRPAKALKYVKSDDSNFEVQEIPTLCIYLGEHNRRIRWETGLSRPITGEEQARIPSLAAGSIPDATKTAKNAFKNTMQPKYLPVLLPIGAICACGEELVLTDPDGNRILLRDRPEDGEDHRTVYLLRRFPIEPGKGCAVFGLLFHDHRENRLCLHPYSIITPGQILRLLY